MPRKSVLSFFFVTFLVIGAAQAEETTENQARVGSVTGDVGLLTQGAKEWIVPREHLPLDPGDLLRTGEDGRVELIVGESALWILEPGTELAVDHVSEREGLFHLSSGTLLGSVQSRDERRLQERWQINTPVAVVAIRGTEFALEFSRAEGARLGVFEGTVEMQPAETAEGPQPPIQVASGEEAFAPRGKPLKRFAHFGERMKAFAAQHPNRKLRHRQIQQVWTPFTASVRKGLRTHEVKPVPKKVPRPVRQPRLKRGPPKI